ncbi:MAG: hypothetical protein WB509_14695, partial [Acetobacteraceae bacterium]
AGFAFVQGPISFFILRFLLGLAEAGFFPGMIFYFTYWFPPFHVSGAKARAWRDFLLAATRSSSIQAACDRPARDVWPVAWGAAGARGEAAGQGDRA